MFSTLNIWRIAMVLPIRHQGPLKLMNCWVQRCLGDVGSKSYFNQWKDVDWSLRSVFNTHRLPMDENGEEQLLEGMHMVEQPFMQASFWPLVQNITIITAPNMAKMGVLDARVQRSSYWGTLEIKGENSNRRWVVSNMHQGNTISALSQKDLLNWGSMRRGLAHEEVMRNNHSNPLDNAHIPARRCNEIAFPHLSFLKETGALPEAPEFGLRLCMDVLEEHVWDVRKALKSEDVESQKGVCINFVKQEVLCNCGYEKLQAWDVTVLRSNFEEVAEVACEVWS